MDPSSKEYLKFCAHIGSWQVLKSAALAELIESARILAAKLEGVEKAWALEDIRVMTNKLKLPLVGTVERPVRKIGFGDRKLRTPGNPTQEEVRQYLKNVKVTDEMVEAAQKIWNDVPEDYVPGYDRLKLAIEAALKELHRSI